MDAEWDDFKILIALSRSGSMTGAARDLKMDSSTVSRRLAGLEQALSTPLVLRQGRELGWTAEGKAALLAAGEMDKAVSAALLKCRAAKLDSTGTVRLACPPALVEPLARRLVPTLKSEQPALRVEIYGAFQRVDLARGEADVAVRAGMPSERNLEAKQVCELGWSVYCAAQALEQLRDFHSGLDVPLVLYVEAIHSSEPLRWLERHRQSTSQVTRVDNVEAANDLVAKGLGLGVLPCFIGDADSRLVRAAPSPVSRNTMFVVHHESARETARVRVLSDALVKFFYGEREFFAGGAR